MLRSSESLESQGIPQSLGIHQSQGIPGDWKVLLKCVPILIVHLELEYQYHLVLASSFVPPEWCSLVTQYHLALRKQMAGHDKEPAASKHSNVLAQAWPESLALAWLEVALTSHNHELGQKPKIRLGLAWLWPGLALAWAGAFGRYA
ncbi:hypothetical protein CPB84DRAFT_1751989 [Gymnopilus junonius]|uniref:Uncharacterized protein n=1 Tax=Gymnopilus junonius TaxID=109634 RepID=A0A9P5NCH9_GYMJU|nr:hypothetical protein CPB84DRAFT_1751989 [Gymnopilus junonius]